MTLHRYNWKPDLPDQRDFKYSKLSAPVILPPILPKQVDLRPLCSPVVNQGDIGSCTGNSLAGHIEFLELKEQRANQVAAPEELATTFAAASRLFIYYNERVIEGTVSTDSGAQIRDGIQTLNQTGVCQEATWAYEDSNTFLQPVPAAYTEAANHKISVYLRLQTMYDMRHCLASGYPFVFGFTVYDSFESAAVAANGIVPMPQPSESCLGGHAVMAVGYDDTKQLITVRNSWGTGWGDQGYFYLPYAYISNPDLADDLWTIRK